MMTIRSIIWKRCTSRSILYTPCDAQRISQSGISYKALRIPPPSWVSMFFPLPSSAPRVYLVAFRSKTLISMKPYLFPSPSSWSPRPLSPHRRPLPAPFDVCPIPWIQVHHRGMPPGMEGLERCLQAPRSGPYEPVPLRALLGHGAFVF